MAYPPAQPADTRPRGLAPVADILPSALAELRHAYEHQAEPVRPRALRVLVFYPLGSPALLRVAGPRVLYVEDPPDSDEFHAFVKDLDRANRAAYERGELRPSEWAEAARLNAAAAASDYRRYAPHHREWIAEALLREQAAAARTVSRARTA